MPNVFYTMIILTEKLSKRHIALLVLAGTIFRIVFAAKTQIWNIAHDQIAWTLANGVWTRQILPDLLFQTHPYSGNHLPFSLVAILLQKFIYSVPALTIVAIICDTVIRYTQTRICFSVLGSSAGWWFGLWQIFAVPLLLPFSSAFFGQMYLCSFFPFVLLWLHQSNVSNKNLCSAILIALAISYSSFCIALIPGWLFLMNSDKQSFRAYLHFSFWLLLFLIPAFWQIFSNTSALGSEHFKLIKPQSAGPFETGFMNLSLFWIQSLPAALFFEPIMLLPKKGELVLALLFISALIILVLTKTDGYSKQINAGWIILLSFQTLYCFSDSFSAKNQNTGFFLYRHLSFIAPLLVMLLFSTSNNRKVFSNLIIFFFIGVSATMSICYTEDFKKIDPPSYEISGWILSNKFKSDVKMLQTIAEMQTEDKKQELLFGYGWGLTSSILEGAEHKDSIRVDELLSLRAKFKPENKNQISKGMLRAFDPGITPVLAPELKSILESSIKEP